MRNSSRWLLAGALLVVLLIPSSAAAAPCGASNPVAGEPSTGALTLDPASSTTDLDFGRSSSPKSFTLVFKVANCDVTTNDGLRVNLRSSDLPTSAAGNPVVDAKGSVLVVQVPINPKEFDPGKFNGIVTLTGPSITTSITSVTLQRSEDNALIPGVICLIALLLGFAWAGYMVWLNVGGGEEGKVVFKFAYALPAIVFAVGAVLVVYKTVYLDVDIWSDDSSAKLQLFLAAAAAAAGGATTGALGKAIVARVQGVGGK